MDLVYYITYHYFEKIPKWMMQEDMESTPKDLYDIIVDLTIKILIIFAIVYAVRRVFMALYTLHDGRRRRLRRLQNIYRDLLRTELQKQEDARKRNERMNRNRNIEQEQAEAVPQEEPELQEEPQPQEE